MRNSLGENIAAALTETPSKVADLITRHPVRSALLLALASCGGKAAVEESDAGVVCPLPPDGGEQTDAGAEALGRAEVEPLGHEGNGRRFYIDFNVPAFDERSVPGFEERGCKGFPMEVRVKFTGQDRNGENDTAVGGRKRIDEPGEDSIDAEVPAEFETASSYTLQLVVTVTDPIDGRTRTIVVDESELVTLDDYGPAELGPAQPPAEEGESEGEQPAPAEEPPPSAEEGEAPDGGAPDAQAAY